MVVGCIRRPRLDVPLAALTVLSAATVSTHFRMVGRYYFQILPWVLYFAAAASSRAPAFVLPRPGPPPAGVIAAVPLLFLVAVHLAVLPGDIDAARDFDARGRQQIGPTDPTITPIFDAVEQHTAPTDVIVFFRARTMTLYTDRRTIQTTNLDRVLRTRRLLRPAALLGLLAARRHAVRGRGSSASSRCGRTTGGSCGGSPSRGRPPSIP